MPLGSRHIYINLWGLSHHTGPLLVPDFSFSSTFAEVGGGDDETVDLLELEMAHVIYTPHRL